MSTEEEKARRQGQAVRQLVCDYCGTSFIPKINFKNRVLRFCSRDCSAANEKNRRRQLIQQAKETGQLNGKPYSEYYYRKLQGATKTRKCDWHLPYDYFLNNLWKKPCYYCGSSIQTVGIDRIDSKKDYEVNNVIPCCTTCNIMKYTLDQNIFLDRIRQIHLHLNL